MSFISIVKREYKFVHDYYWRRKFRKVNIPNVSELIESENASVHWKYLDVADKIILDLGCGIWDTNDIEESSPIYFKKKGAKKIIGVDLNGNDIKILTDYFDKHYKGDGSEFLVKMITTTDDYLDLITKYQVESIKCDIEGFEKVMFNLDKSQIANIKSISVEYHDHILLLALIDTFARWDFKIINHSIFSYSMPDMGVLTAVQN